MGAFENAILSEEEVSEIAEEGVENEEFNEQDQDDQFQETSGEADLEGSEEGRAEDEEGREGSEEGDEKEVNEEDLQKTYRVKANGEDMDIPLQQLIDSYSLKQASYEKMEKASMLQKQAQSLVKGLKDDTITTLEQLGVDFKKVATDYLSDRVAYEMKPEHERQLHDYKLQLKRLQDEKDQRAEMERRQKETQEKEQVKSQLLGEMTTAIDEVGGLPKNEQTFAAMANYAEQLIRAGVQNVPMARVAKVVKEKYEENLRNVFENMDEEKRMAFVGKHAKGISTNYAKQYNKNTLKSPTQKRARVPQAEKQTFRDLFGGEE